MAKLFVLLPPPAAHLTGAVLEAGGVPVIDGTSGAIPEVPDGAWVRTRPGRPAPGRAGVILAELGAPVPDRETWLEAAAPRDILPPGFAGLVLKGRESGGFAGEEDGLELLARSADPSRVILDAGLGPRTAGAAAALGAGGVFLSEQHLGLPELDLPASMRRRLELPDEEITHLVNGQSPVRVGNAATAPVLQKLLSGQDPWKLAEDLWRRGDLSRCLWMAGQGLALATGLAERYPSLPALLAAYLQAMAGWQAQVRLAHPVPRARPVGHGAALAEEGTAAASGRMVGSGVLWEEATWMGRPVAGSPLTGALALGVGVMAEDSEIRARVAELAPPLDAAPPPLPTGPTPDWMEAMQPAVQALLQAAWAATEATAPPPSSSANAALSGLTRAPLDERELSVPAVQALRDAALLAEGAERLPEGLSGRVGALLATPRLPARPGALEDLAHSLAMTGPQAYLVGPTAAALAPLQAAEWLDAGHADHVLLLLPGEGVTLPTAMVLEAPERCAARGLRPLGTPGGDDLPLGAQLAGVALRSGWTLDTSDAPRIDEAAHRAWREAQSPAPRAPAPAPPEATGPVTLEELDALLGGPDEEDYPEELDDDNLAELDELGEFAGLFQSAPTTPAENPFDEAPTSKTPTRAAAPDSPTADEGPMWVQEPFEAPPQDPFDQLAPEAEASAPDPFLSILETAEEGDHPFELPVTARDRVPAPPEEPGLSWDEFIAQGLPEDPSDVPPPNRLFAPTAEGDPRLSEALEAAAAAPPAPQAPSEALDFSEAPTLALDQEQLHDAANLGHLLPHDAAPGTRDDAPRRSGDDDPSFDMDAFLDSFGASDAEEQELPAELEAMLDQLERQAPTEPAEPDALDRDLDQLTGGETPDDPLDEAAPVPEPPTDPAPVPTPDEGDAALDELLLGERPPPHEDDDLPDDIQIAQEVEALLDAAGDGLLRDPPRDDLLGVSDDYAPLADLADPPSDGLLGASDDYAPLADLADPPSDGLLGASDDRGPLADLPSDGLL
ncbi:MAG: hypothetical protein JXX28_02835, partial [Deltaproteobacteria bacterium]|nr:hypothetical protein [Deltaproteobacteria bacterium]